MKAIIELNEKYGYGYQARMIIGGLEGVIDGHPAKLADILTGIQDALNEINEREGKQYDLNEVIGIEKDALEINAIYDPFSAEFFEYLMQREGQTT